MRKPLSDIVSKRRSLGSGFVALMGAVLLFAGIVPVAAQAEGESLDPPRIEPEKNMVHAGTVVQGEAVEVEFVLHNRGGETLQILRAKPG